MRWAITQEKASVDHSSLQRDHVKGLLVSSKLKRWRDYFGEGISNTHSLTNCIILSEKDDKMLERVRQS